MSERRNYVRVDTTLRYHYEKIDSVPEVWGRTSTIYLTRTYVDIPTFTDKMETEDLFRLLYSALGEIKDEISSMKERLGLKTERMMSHRINISGSGASFWDDSKKLEKGDKVLFTVVLPLELPLMVKSVAEVVNEPTHDPEIGGYRHKLRFVLIDPEDRELIIRYTFKRQRELINLKKHDTEES